MFSRILYLCMLIKKIYKMAKFSREKELEIINLYVNEQKTQKEIACIYNTYNTSIRRVLQRNNITIRSNSEVQRKISLEDIIHKEGSDSFDYFLGILITDGCNTNGAIVLDFCEENKINLNKKTLLARMFSLEDKDVPEKMNDGTKYWNLIYTLPKEIKIFN